MKGVGILLLCTVWLVGCGGASEGGTVKTFPVSVSTNQGGSVNAAQAIVEHKSTTSFNFTAETGYHLKTVSGCNGKLIDTTYTTGPVTAACSVTAAFERNAYSVTVNASADGTFTIRDSKTLHGDTAVIAAVPKAGYGFATFSGCGAGISTDSGYTTAPVTADCTVSLSFTKTAVIQGSAAEGAALVGAEVNARCSDDSTFATKVLTDSAGKFSGQVAEQAFPCALKITTAAPIKTYYSIATQAGTTNINPLTDLSLVLASGNSNADWYVSSDWTNVKTNLADAQTSLKSALYNLGYILPGGDFLPFRSTFALDGSWDKLLDQIQLGIAKTSSMTYESLAAALRNGNAQSLPAPTGGSAPTAEICFNPVLYAEGTTLKTKAAGGAPINDIYYNSERVAKFTNGKKMVENGVPVLTRATEGSLTYTTPTGGPLPSSSTGTEKLLVNLEEKNIGQLILDTTTLTENSLSSPSEYTSTFTSVGNQTNYNLAQDTSTNETFEFLSRTLTPVRDNGARWTVKITKTFKGLTTVMRKGVVYRVCDFEIHKVEDNYQWLSGTRTDWKDRDTTGHQYIMLGTGVELPANILSVVLNGQELLNGKPN